jgi:general secretion pathway protein K
MASGRVRFRRVVRGKGGFALVTVIWGLALITLLIVSFMTTARLRLQTAFNIAGATQASLAADAALGAALIALTSEREPGLTGGNPPLHDGAPQYCTLANALVSLSVEDESGKIDLNGASPKLLLAALTGLGVDKKEAEAVASAIVAFRTQPTNAIEASFNARAGAGDKPFGPKQALFQTALELDQVEGVGAALFRALLPVVTVNSRSAGIDRRVAPPALFAALAGSSSNEVEALRIKPFPNGLDRTDPRFPIEFNQQGVRGAVMAHVEILLPTGQTAVKEAIFDFNDGRGVGSATKELRRGVPRDLDSLRAIARDGGGAPPC